MYFNEHDAKAAAWLRNLYPEAVIDSRSIHDVKPDDVAGFRRCHFFGGIAGWQYALELAGWPDEREVWTGSCPCQPFSSAGKRKGNADERHLWPEWFRLIRECRPQCIFGEQVASAIGHGWLDGISADLEAEGYAVGACVLGAHSVGAPHIRQRLYWLGVSDSAGSQPRLKGIASTRHGSSIVAASNSRELGDANGSQRGSRRRSQRRIGGETIEPLPATGGEVDRLASDSSAGLARRSLESTWTECQAAERSSSAILCRDGKLRRISAQPGDEPLAYGIPRTLGRDIPQLRSVAASARSNRVARLRGYGNAIVPQVAAEFIRAASPNPKARK